MSKFTFGADYHRDLRERALNELAEGTLPGIFGLLQQVAGHWSIPKADRGLIRYGKASLDTIGATLSYRNSRQKIIDGGKDPSVLWLTDEGYKDAFPSAGYAYTSFIGGALCGVYFDMTTVRDKLGRPAQSTLLSFEIAKGKTAYYLDKQGNTPKRANLSSHDAHWTWDGPYIKEGDEDVLLDFVRETVWKNMGTDTLLLSCDSSITGDRIQIEMMDDTLDFCSGMDFHNDVVQLARRCKAFTDNGRCRSLLFYGPPGTGKSTLARAIARELKRRVLLIDHAAVSRMSGSAHRIISLLQPGVLVLNDIDRSGRDDMISLLMALEREHKDNPLLTCITVNDIKQLDPALLRPGRVHETREIPEPSPESRKLILTYYTEKYKLRLNEEEIKGFMENSDEFSPADVREFCETALAVGVEIAIGECERIREQRNLYAGDKCAEFNEASKPDSVGRRRRH